MLGTRAVTHGENSAMAAVDASGPTGLAGEGVVYSFLSIPRSTLSCSTLMREAAPGMGVGKSAYIFTKYGSLGVPPSLVI